jgi:hypothetical protein
MFNFSKTKWISMVSKKWVLRFHSFEILGSIRRRFVTKKRNLLHFPNGERYRESLEGFKRIPLLRNMKSNLVLKIKLLLFWDILEVSTPGLMSLLKGEIPKGECPR